MLQAQVFLHASSNAKESSDHNPERPYFVVEFPAPDQIEGKHRLTIRVSTAYTNCEAQRQGEKPKEDKIHWVLLLIHIQRP